MSSVKIKRTRVIVAMSGGVDSSVSAALLKKEGYEVIGVTLRMKKCDENSSSKSCCGINGIANSRLTASTLGIKHFVLDVSELFEKNVLRPAWHEYSQGRTPSPCIVCNSKIKFGYLLSWANKVGADYIATGHYAKITVKDQLFSLARGNSKKKDQSYFLSALSSKQLSRIMFPIGKYSKKETRGLAVKLGLSCAETPDSQDVCFAEKGKSFPAILKEKFNGKVKKGVFVDQAGNHIGNHDGIHLYTLGQRKKLSVSLPGPCWVQEINPFSGEITITPDSSDLCKTRFAVDRLVLNSRTKYDKTIRCQVQARYRQKPVSAFLRMTDKKHAIVELVSPVRAPTPGQAAVFYMENEVLGMGRIIGNHDVSPL